LPAKIAKVELIGRRDITGPAPGLSFGKDETGGYGGANHADDHAFDHAQRQRLSAIVTLPDGVSIGSAETYPSIAEGHDRCRKEAAGHLRAPGSPDRPELPALLGTGAPIVLAGNYNIRPTDLDVYKPKRWVDDALFRPAVRDAD
jgi:hypothetical protein